MMHRRALLALAATPLAAPALAQPQWPDKPIRLIVPFAPGGGTDISGRMVAQRLSEHWGQPVVVENRGGAGGMIGARAVGSAPPDGSTLMYNGTLSILRDNFDPRTVVDHVARVLITHNILVVNRSVPSRTVPEFIAWLKERPGRANHGTSGPLAQQHLAAVMFDLMAGTRMENIHYRGTGPSVAAIIADEVQVMFGSISAVLPLIEDGRVRALATASARRSALLPQIPVMADFLPGYAAELTYSLCAPLNTPAPIKRRIEEAAQRILADERFVGELRTRGFEPDFATDPQLSREIEADVQRWAEVARRANLNLNEG